MGNARWATFWLWETKYIETFSFFLEDRCEATVIPTENLVLRKSKSFTVSNDFSYISSSGFATLIPILMKNWQHK